MSFTEIFQLKYTWQFTTEYLLELQQVRGLIESIVSSIDFHMAVEIMLKHVFFMLVLCTGNLCNTGNLP